uniref:(California timema) hypothetical protein n=1 Tax=Timema californicum TaxID=61474 RepID=A0A7R9J6N3_TIMCA|nr:unnamed protein product [Timema californicum]
MTITINKQEPVLSGESDKFPKEGSTFLQPEPGPINCKSPPNDLLQINNRWYILGKHSSTVFTRNQNTYGNNDEECVSNIVFTKDLQKQSDSKEEIEDGTTAIMLKGINKIFECEHEINSVKEEHFDGIELAEQIFIQIHGDFFSKEDNILKMATEAVMEKTNEIPRETRYRPSVGVNHQITFYIVISSDVLDTTTHILSMASNIQQPCVILTHKTVDLGFHQPRRSISRTVLARQQDTSYMSYMLLSTRWQPNTLDFQGNVQEWVNLLPE